MAQRTVDKPGQFRAQAVPVERGDKPIRERDAVLQLLSEPFPPAVGVETIQNAVGFLGENSPGPFPVSALYGIEHLIEQCGFSLKIKVWKYFICAAATAA